MANTTHQPPAGARPAERKSPPSTAHHPNDSCEPARRRDAEELFRRHHKRLVGLLQSRLRIPRELAEDACSVAWIQLLRKQPRRDQIIAWLYTVAKHEAFVLMRRARREPVYEELAWLTITVDQDEVVAARDALRLLGHLKPQQQQVLLLQAQGHSYKAICQLTGRSYTWVNRHITEGRRTLRKLIERS
jgi:RNA polymerase sigma factor (sigma-70 family)